MHKTYGLVVTDDYSRYNLVFFLASKDETTSILKKFITEIENLVDKKVKAKAVNIDCYVHNRALVVKPHNKTPYELFRDRTPALSFMRPFRSHVTILNTLDHLGKFDGKADEGYFVGYSINSKAFRVYNIRTRRVKENLHIEFLENKPIVVQTQMILQKDGSPLFDSSSKISDDAGSLLFDDPKMPVLETITTYNDSEEEADFTNLESLIYVSPTSTTRIHKNHPLKQVIGSLNTPVQTRSKLKPTNKQGFISAVYEGKTYEDLNTCLFAYFLSPIEPTRVSKALSDPTWMVVKSDFIYGRIKDEVYVCQPSGFEDPDHPNKVYKVVKALYGLHQAPRAWVTTVKFASTLVDTEKTLVKDVDGDDVDVHLYRSMIRSLMYLTTSRPYIIDSLFELVAYTDGDYAESSLDRKSTTGGF
nr:retrovirus-related Pol polyprotein from transposon TNT 1-94 [Tanacetum cinerariifolium]